jgi:hypothetical protein
VKRLYPEAGVLNITASYVKVKCDILGYYSGVTEQSNLLGCDVMSSGGFGFTQSKMNKHSFTQTIKAI